MREETRVDAREAVGEVSYAEHPVSVRHVFVIGAKSIGQYGGYETFIDKLTEQHQGDPSVQYHIACKANGEGFMDEAKLVGVKVTKKRSDGSVAEFTYHNAHVFKISCPNIGSAVAVYYDRAAVMYSIRYCKEHRLEHPIFYILTCRIGLFMDSLVRQIRAVGGTYVLNPDGHEWKRAKWPVPVRKYWKWSEGRMVERADVVVCDSVCIERYIRRRYGHPHTVFIAYGSDTAPSVLAGEDPKCTAWLREKGLRPGAYYLVVGRFVPENNYETMIREYLRSHTERELAIVTNANERFIKKLEKKLDWKKDKRIRFVGTVYDTELLKKIRENAYGYLHGHEVGGTNPSLLESLGSTALNLLLDVCFNREVGSDAALYWEKAEGSLAALLDRADRMSAEERMAYGDRARNRVQTAYSWPLIGSKYRRLWREL